jgi:MutL-like protein
VGLKGVQQERTISDTFEQTASGETIVRLDHLDLLVGSGGVLSHAPRRAQAALMMLDAFLPEQVTELAVDSIFMMPQLGVLSTVHPRAAKEVFEKDCLIRLGSSVAPVGPGKEAVTMLRVALELPGGKREEFSLPYGSMRLVPLGLGETAKAVLRPEKGFDVGEGKGKERTVTLKGGVVGLIFDGRGRLPFRLPEDRAARIAKLNQWNESLGIYPERAAAAAAPAPALAARA